MDSQKWTLNKTDIWKTIRGGLVIAAGAFLVYAAQAITNFDFATLDPMYAKIAQGVAVTLSASLLEIGRRWMSGPT